MSRRLGYKDFYLFFFLPTRSLRKVGNKGETDSFEVIRWPPGVTQVPCSWLFPQLVRVSDFDGTIKESTTSWRHRELKSRKGRDRMGSDLIRLFINGN